MNTQLVNSIIQMVRSLPEAEQKMLVKQVNQLFFQSSSHQEDSMDMRVSKDPEESIDEEAWAIWQSIGDDAVSGTLDNPSIHHDRYLYSKSL
ncbi:MAG: hypothetical protein AAF327_23655 [Cyanobacteria bacterium P01_A01_bin.37]